ncbi:MAG: hypothetical protein HPY58_08885 [Firmicutes bacterium]|nr:hypothetical protein [Bacillota bacterium]
MGNWWTLAKNKLKETWNERMRFGRSGLWFVLLELATLVMICFGMGSVLKNRADGLEPAGILGFLTVMTFLVAFGNGYLFSERMLFGRTARVDRLLAVAPRDVVLSTVLVAYLANLRPTLLSPILMALALAHAWFPEKQIPLLGLAFLAPFFGTALAVLAVVLVKKFLNRLSGLAFIIAPALQVGGLAGTVWLVIDLAGRRTITREAWINLPAFQHLLWWAPALLMTGGILLFALARLAHLWEETQWQLEGRGSRRQEKNQVRSILALLSAFRLPPPIQAVILKEWLSLRRNPLTTLRIVAWAIISLAPLLSPGLRSLISTFPSPLIAVFAIWFFCFGELVATAYQAEGRRLGLLWLAAVSPGQLALGKFLAYLPLALFAAGTAGVMILIFSLQRASALPMIILAFTGTVAGIALSLAPASLSMNTVNYQGNSLTELAFEQVPTTFYSIASTIILGGLLAAFSIAPVFLKSTGMVPLFSAWIGAVAGSAIIGIAGIAAASYLLKRRFLL